MKHVGCLLAVILGLAGCHGGDSPDQAADSVVVSATIVDGNDQTVVVGSVAPIPLTASLRNASGSAVVGQGAYFVVASGGGSVSSPVVVSGLNGVVTTGWALGTTPAAQAVDLVIFTGDSRLVLATFTGRAIAGDARSLAILSGDNQVGAPLTRLPLPLKVVVRDAYGNPVPGAVVSFTPSDSGTVSPATTVTDDTGVASSIWTFGTPGTGERTLSAATGNLPAVTFIAAAFMQPFTVPRTLTFKTLAVHEIEIAWSYDSEDSPGFKVERKSGASGTWTEIATTPFHPVSACVFRYMCTDFYKDSNLAPATEYHYRVRAYSGPLVSEYSNEVHGTTLPGDPIHTEPYTGMVMIKVPGGTYHMGDTSGVGVHLVSVSDFYIGEFEVTQAEWLAVMGNNPSSHVACGSRCPVDQVSWLGADEFVQKLNQLTGRTYRLASEAEWEYAARSGGLNEIYSGGNDIDAVAWYDANSGYTTHPVGQKQANGLGLHDMSGNVEEWVSDNYGQTFATDHVIRGGGADGGPTTTTSRAHERPGAVWEFLGFRIVMSGQ